MMTAVTMTYAEEAIGLTRAATAVGLPVVVSFTVETDGSLPSGQTIADAIAQVDNTTGAAPAHFMINCAHPPLRVVARGWCAVARTGQGGAAQRVAISGSSAGAAAPTTSTRQPSRRDLLLGAKNGCGLVSGL
jgi:hypothetical protein